MKMFDTAATVTDHGENFLIPGIKYTSTIDSVSMMIALVLGTSGLPHILMRFFTVKDAKTARKSIHMDNLDYSDFLLIDNLPWLRCRCIRRANANILAANPGGNLAAPLLAEFLGGNVLLSFISAVAFATILAVVSGLVLTGASAISHDIYGEIMKNGKLTPKQQLVAARTGSISIAVLSILLALGAQTLNVSFLVSFAFCIGASANLPVILYTIYWKKFNSNGAIIAMATGLISCLILGALGPNVWNPEAGKAIFVGTPLIALSNPAIISVPLGFLAGWLGTILTQNKANEAKNEKIYNEIRVKANTGISVSDVSH